MMPHNTAHTKIVPKTLFAMLRREMVSGSINHISSAKSPKRVASPSNPKSKI
jgi:hypothetical protein